MKRAGGGNVRCSSSTTSMAAGVVSSVMDAHPHWWSASGPEPTDGLPALPARRPVHDRHVGARVHPGVQIAQGSDAVRADEDVHVTTLPARLVQHAVDDAGMLGPQDLQELADGGVVDDARGEPR